MPREPQSFTVHGVTDLLRREGLRITRNRTRILEVLFEADHPLSLHEIREAATDSDGGPDYATVFRMMMLMENLGLVHKVNLQRSCTYYEIRDPGRHYDHVVCRRCGRVEVVDLPCALAETEKKIAQQHGFSDLSHSLEFFGVCAECRT